MKSDMNRIITTLFVLSMLVNVLYVSIISGQKTEIVNRKAEIKALRHTIDTIIQETNLVVMPNDNGGLEIYEI